MHCLCRAAGVCIDSCGKAGRSSSSVAIIQQLSASLLRLYRSILLSSSEKPAIAAQLRIPIAAQQHHNHVIEATLSARHPENSESAQQQPNQAAVTSLQQDGPLSTIQSAHMAVLGLALHACQACNADAETLPVLTLYLQACRILQNRGHLLPLKAIDSFLRSSVIAKLE